MPMIIRHGLDPLLSRARIPGCRHCRQRSSRSWRMTINPPNLAFTSAVVGAVIARSGADGTCWSGWRQRIRRGRLDRWVAIPLAVLAGLAVDAALSNRRASDRSRLLAVRRRHATITGVALAPIVPKRITAEQRAIMAWAAAETPADTTFAVIGYPADRGMWSGSRHSRSARTSRRGRAASGFRAALIGARSRQRLPAADPSSACPTPTITCSARRAARSWSRG